MSESIDVLARIKTTGDLLVLLTGEPLANHPIREVYEAVSELIEENKRALYWCGMAGEGGLYGLAPIEKQSQPIQAWMRALANCVPSEESDSQGLKPE